MDQKSTVKIILGDCLEILKSYPDNHFDSIVTDPPYGLKLLGKKWDYDVPNKAIWSNCLRVLKPGGHLLAFGGTRTYHRLVVSIEDAGFEIRDQIQWIYSQGYPKTRNTLKPANEPICLARKPLSESTVAKNVLKWGTGTISIDTCRIPGKLWSTKAHTSDSLMVDKRKDLTTKSDVMFRNKPDQQSHELGRWPANILFDEESAEVLGSYSSFFYVAKPSAKERKDNPHPTVKPIKLMEYLIKLITPPGGIVLDPFMGSGTTGVAAINLGYEFIGIEMSKEYIDIAHKRITLKFIE